MKKTILYLSLILAFSPGYPQKFTPVLKQGLFSSEQIKHNYPETRNLKGGGEIIFKETFNWKDPGDPKGFAIPEGWELLDANRAGHNWVWRAGTDSIKGKFTAQPGHIYSKTPEDGYLVLPMDEYNFIDGIVTDLSGNSWFGLPPMDFSDRPGVILSLSQNFRACCDYTPDIKCLVSNDQGDNWVVYDLSFGTQPNQFCSEPYPLVNISSTAAGMPDVWIRFHWEHGSHYFWCIDDLVFFEAYQNQISLDQSWLNMTDLIAEDKDEGFYYMVPFSQVGIGNFGEYTFKGIIFNGGNAAQDGCNLNVEVFKNGTSVYNQSSNSRNLSSQQRDTFAITTPFIPTGYGDYQMVLTAKQDQTDAFPSDNSYTDTFYISDSVYSMCDWEPEGSVSPNMLIPGMDKDHLGLVYDITKACEVNSISCLIYQRKDLPQISTQPGHGIIYKIFQWDKETSRWGEKNTSEYVTITQEMINNWLTLPMSKDGESEFLEPGQYIIAFQAFTGSVVNPTGEFVPLTIGADRSHPFSSEKMVILKANDENWYTMHMLYGYPMIRLNLAESGAPHTADVVFNVDMTLPIANGFFHPAWGEYVDISGTFNNWGGSERMTDPDGDGIYTLTVPGLPTFQPIEYKYRINGIQIVSEISPVLNRVYRTSYFNILNDMFNNGISLGTRTDRLWVSVRAYPNPADRAFTLEINNPAATDLLITVINLQGQSVYSNQVKSVMNYCEVIDVSTFTKGLYLLKINAQVMKLVVK